MDQLWAGWRQSFIEGNQTSKIEAKCVLCTMGDLEPSPLSHVVFRGTHNYVVLNAYPYTPGHLMVVPYAHVAMLTEIEPQVLVENSLVMQKCVEVLTKVYAPGGFNVGANIGRAGGAAIDDHVHFHVVPRWIGDTNFMTSIANIRVLPESLESSYVRIFDWWQKSYVTKP